MNAEQDEQQLTAMRQKIDEKRLHAPPDSVPSKQVQAAYGVAKSEPNDSANIHGHRYRFVSRYDDKGDFMGCQHHVAENGSRAVPYAPPYDGRV